MTVGTELLVLVFDRITGCWEVNMELGPPSLCGWRVMTEVVGICIAAGLEILNDDDTDDGALAGPVDDP